MGLKKCKKCLEEKPICEFSFTKRDGYIAQCRNCKKLYYDPEKAKAYNKQYTINNKDKIAVTNKRRYDSDPELYAKRNKKYREENLEKISLINKRYREANQVKCYESHKKWVKDNPEAVRAYKNAYVKKRFETDPLFKLSYTLRSSIRRIVKGEIKNQKPETVEMLGCTFEEVKNHLEALFLKGMSWGNHGYGEGKWHIDHKYPLALAKNKEEIIKLSHFTNLQPMWHRDNLVKNKYVPKGQLQAIL